MRWTVFATLTYFILGLQLGLSQLFAVEVSGQPVAPSLMLVFLVFLAASAPAIPALWAALILGLLVDLTTPIAAAENAENIIVAGPHALGYVLGCLLTIQLRVMIYRRHPLTMALLTFAAGITVHVLAVFMISCRDLLSGWFPVYEIFAWSATDQLYLRFFELLYSAAAALPLGWALNLLAPVFGFHVHPRLGHVR